MGEDGAYGVFANGGYLLSPWLVQRVSDARGKVLFESDRPATPPEEARTIDARNAFVTDSMLREVTRTGTATSASLRLERHLPVTRASAQWAWTMRRLTDGGAG